MNKKAEFNLQAMLISIALLGLFATLVGILITSLGGSYDATGYDSDDVGKYQVLDNLSRSVATAKGQIDTATVDTNWFDFLSGIFNTILTPFKFMYRSVATLFTLSGSVVSDLGLLKVIGDFLITVLTILVFVGIVMIKNYMGRSK